MISSNTSRSSPLGTHCAAATFCLTCSADVAPAITDPTVGIADSPPIAPSRIEIPLSGAPRRLIRSKLPGRAEPAASQPDPGSGRPLAVLRYPSRPSAKNGNKSWPVLQGRMCLPDRAAQPGAAFCAEMNACSRWSAMSNQRPSPASLQSSTIRCSAIALGHDLGEAASVSSIGV